MADRVSPLTGWTFDALPLVLLALLSLAYGRRLRTLRIRGTRARRRTGIAFMLSLAVLVLAVASPIDRIGEERLFSIHMVQHLLIGDLAPLLAVLGLNGPLLRPVLALPLASVFRSFARPLVALPLWAANLYAWHLPVLYDAALDHAAVHAAEHLSFFAAGFLLWSSVLELLPGPRWYGTGAKLASLAGVWLAGGVLANVFLWSSHSFYPPYRSAPRLWHLSPVVDQRIGGGLMLLEMTLVVLPISLLLGLRWLGESERRQQLLESGWQPARAARAIRYRGEPDA